MFGNSLQEEKELVKYRQEKEAMKTKKQHRKRKKKVSR